MAGYKGVDPKGHLNKDDYKEWEQSSGKKIDQLSDDQIDDINESIAVWAKRDPDGKNDALARKLDESVLGIMKRKASKTAFSSAILDVFAPSHSSMVTVYEDGSVEWVDEIQTERFRDMRQATRWVQNLVSTGRGEWWATDAKKALNWLKRVRVASSPFKVQMLDDGDVEWEGSSKEFLEDNDNDPDIADALKKLKRKGDTVNVGGGAGAEFTLRRASRAQDKKVGDTVRWNGKTLKIIKVFRLDAPGFVNDGDLQWELSNRVIINPKGDRYLDPDDRPRTASSTKTSSVEVQLVKLGSSNPELRPHIRPILAALKN